MNFKLFFIIGLILAVFALIGSVGLEDYFQSLQKHPKEILEGVKIDCPYGYHPTGFGVENANPCLLLVRLTFQSLTFYKTVVE